MVTILVTDKSDSGNLLLQILNCLWRISCSLCECDCELKYCRKWMMNMMNQLLHNLQKTSKNLKVLKDGNDDEKTIKSRLKESLCSKADSNLLNVSEDVDYEDDVEE
ncbi:hypothetical protein M9H77_21091 [Catharanthus roseus]|uniref:Uncharacterized protein n=1 Tax=Catharanthus roseus TaxID=4058 RepID=A0ACC0ALC7_CATRO|nr:hypothetical protein M9H77_21091 [Catharanthus roseus]